MAINLGKLKAVYEGREESILRFDVLAGTVDLRWSGNQSLSDVTILHEDLDSPTNEREQIIDERESLLEARENNVFHKELLISDREKVLQISMDTVYTALEAEYNRVKNQAIDLATNMNQVIHDHIVAEKVREDNEIKAEATPNYMKYEDRVFNENLLEPLEDFKELIRRERKLGTKVVKRVGR